MFDAYYWSYMYGKLKTPFKVNGNLKNDTFFCDKEDYFKEETLKEKRTQQFLLCSSTNLFQN